MFSDVDLIGDDTHLINEILDKVILRLQIVYLELYNQVKSQPNPDPIKKEGYYMRRIEMLELHTTVRFMTVTQRKYMITQLAAEYNGLKEQ